MTVLEKIADALELGEDEDVRALTIEAVDSGLEPDVILDQGLLAGMRIIGKQFKEHEPEHVAI